MSNHKRAELGRIWVAVLSLLLLAAGAAYEGRCATADHSHAGFPFDCCCVCHPDSISPIEPAAALAGIPPVTHEWVVIQEGARVELEPPISFGPCRAPPPPPSAPNEIA